MTDANSRRSVVLNPAKALKRTDFYRIESPDPESPDVPPLLMETILSEIEGSAKPLIDDLIVTGRCDDPTDMGDLALFIAMQITRGSSHRAELSAMATESTKLMLSYGPAGPGTGPPDDFIRQRLREGSGRPASDSEVASARSAIDDLIAGRIYVAPAKAAAVALAAEVGAHLVPYLFDREWLIYRAPYSGLITCDEPVVLLPAPGSDRRARPGVATAGAVLMALDPETVLAMFRLDAGPGSPGRVVDLLPSEVAEIDLEIAANSHHWMIEQPNTTISLGIALPPPMSPVKIEGPLLGVQGASDGDLYRHFKPTRWANQADVPPLPVARWWT